MSALGVTLLLSLATSVIPAAQAARSDPQEFLRGHRLAPPGDRRLRRGLVVAEVAFTMLLLVGSSLLFLSLHRLLAVPVGFNTENLLAIQIQSGAARARDPGATTRFFERVTDAVRTVPGVVRVGATNQLPLAGGKDAYGVRFEIDALEQPNEQGFSSFRYAVSPGYLGATRLPLLHGRGFTSDDGENAPRVALVSAALARTTFASPADAVGKRLRIGSSTSEPYLVVGVVGDVKQVSLALSQPEAVYTTPRQWPNEERAMTLVVRTESDPSALTSAVRRAIWTIDPNQPIGRIATMQSLVEAMGADRRFVLVLFEVFALAALILAAAGCYGVLASYVSDRTREIGVRSVLGATSGVIVGQVSRHALGLIAPGVILGLVASLFATNALTSLLYGLTRLNIVAYAIAIGLILVVSIIAAGIPAWRAARIDPALTLKSH
jgi:predicted permease